MDFAGANAALSVIWGWIAADGSIPPIRMGTIPDDRRLRHTRWQAAAQGML